MTGVPESTTCNLVPSFQNNLSAFEADLGRAFDAVSPRYKFDEV